MPLLLLLQLPQPLLVSTLCVAPASVRQLLPGSCQQLLLPAHPKVIFTVLVAVTATACI
jgi:hypothetical protein